MGMRSDCSHYHRRTTQSGGIIEACALDAAPDAPDACPESCPYFEKRKLSTAGFVYGSLRPEPGDRETQAPSGEGRAVLDELKAYLDEVSDDVVREESAKKKKPQRKRFRRRR